MFQEYYPVFAKAQLCQDIDLEVLESALAKLCPVVKHYGKGEVIFSEGSAKVCFGMVLRGEIMQIRVKPSGERSIYELQKSGQLFGEILMFSPRRPCWTNDIVAKTDCSVMLFKIDRFLSEEFLGSEAGGPMLLNLLHVVCRRYDEMQILLRSLKTRTVRQRIANYLYERLLVDGSLQLKIGLNRDEMAELLNLPRPSLSRELSAMKKDGIIDYFKDSFKINDLSALQRCLLS